jgi:hypothetical protein
LAVIPTSNSIMKKTDNFFVIASSLSLRQRRKERDSDERKVSPLPREASRQSS